MLKNFQISKSIIVFIKINFFLIVSLNIVAQNNTIIGIDKTEEYLPLIIDKNIAIVSNHTSQFIKESNSIHLVDSLLKLNVQVKKVFAPEHGFREKLLILLMKKQAFLLFHYMEKKENRALKI